MQNTRRNYEYLSSCLWLLIHELSANTLNCAILSIQTPKLSATHFCSQYLNNKFPAIPFLIFGYKYTPRHSTLSGSGRLDPTGKTSLGDIRLYCDCIPCNYWINGGFASHELPAKDTNEMDINAPAAHKVVAED